jgi:HEAT repeat protein
MTEETDQRPATRAQLDSEQLTTALSSADPTIRREAIDDFGALARTDLDAAIDHAEAVVDRLTDESLVDVVVESLAADAIDLSLAGAKLLTPLAIERPGEFGESADRLLVILAAEDVPTPETTVPETVDGDEARQLLQSVQRETVERRQYVRRTAANAVVAAVESDPTSVTDIATLETLLDDTDPGVVGPALDALGAIAESDPATVSPVLDSIRDCLDHDEHIVRARAVRTLGFLGAQEAVPALRDVAAEDDDETVRELAAETAAFLAEE